MAAFSIDPDSPLTAWGQVQQDLRHRIDAGEFGGGEKLPSETTLANEYGVSRATVRRCIQSFVRQGVLHAKRGSGTYVSGRGSTPPIVVSLLRPWREQLLTTGHVARSRLLVNQPGREVPPELLRFVEYDSPDELRFGLHLQEVDGVPIAITESWSPLGVETDAMPRGGSAPAVASGVTRVAFATATQAEMLQTAAGTALFEVTTCSRLRQTGELLEIARTSWVAARVHLGYSRALTAGQIDMTELLSFGGDA